jgi:hypothetical protein
MAAARREHRIELTELGGRWLRIGGPGRALKRSRDAP